MASSTYYRVNTPRVVHETIDDEVVIIDLDTGSYYSLDGVGAVIWNRLDQNATPAQIAGWLAEQYGAGAPQIESAVDTLTAELQAEALILPVEGQPMAAGAFPANGVLALPDTFATPILHKHTDMQDLLLLDPIHEVDDSGWPAIKKGAV